MNVNVLRWTIEARRETKEWTNERKGKGKEKWKLGETKTKTCERVRTARTAKIMTESMEWIRREKKSENRVKWKKSG